MTTHRLDVMNNEQQEPTQRALSKSSPCRVTLRLVSFPEPYLAPDSQRITLYWGELTRKPPPKKTCIHPKTGARTSSNVSGALLCHGFGKKREKPRKIAGLAAPSLWLKPQMAAEPDESRWFRHVSTLTLASRYWIHCFGTPPSGAKRSWMPLMRSQNLFRSFFQKIPPQIEIQMDTCGKGFDCEHCI